MVPAKALMDLFITKDGTSKQDRFALGITKKALVWLVVEYEPIFGGLKSLHTTSEKIKLRSLVKGCQRYTWLSLIVHFYTSANSWLGSSRKCQKSRTGKGEKLLEFGKKLGLMELKFQIVGCIACFMYSLICCIHSPIVLCSGLI